MIVIVVTWLLLCYWRLWRFGRNGRFFRRPVEPGFAQAPASPVRFRKKPDSVVRKVIRLKALCPDSSLRIIAQQFNRMEARTSGETVSHAYVGYILRDHRHEVALLSAKIRKQRPRPVPHHLIWAADLTFLPGADRKPRPVLGIIEHASRACLVLTALQTKTSVLLLRALADVIELLEVKPKILRTDNEAIFTSKAFTFGLWLAGIRHQRTDVCSPWQNGKIERFFGTLKRKAKGLMFHSIEELNTQLQVFRFWYQRIRPHQYLDYRTPFEAFHREPIQYAQASDPEPAFFEAWQGRLTGFWFRHE